MSHYHNVEPTTHLSKWIQTKKWIRLWSGVSDHISFHPKSANTRICDCAGSLNRVQDSDSVSFHVKRGGQRGDYLELFLLLIQFSTGQQGCVPPTLLPREILPPTKENQGLSIKHTRIFFLKIFLWFSVPKWKKSSSQPVLLFQDIFKKVLCWLVKNLHFGIKNVRCINIFIWGIPHICHFFTRAKFLENKIYTEKRQIFALNL